MEACDYVAMTKLLLAFRKFSFYCNVLELPTHSLCSELFTL